MTPADDIVDHLRRPDGYMYGRSTLLNKAADTIEEMRAEIAALRAGREWRDIAGPTTPRDGTPILVAVTGGGREPVVGEAWWKIDRDGSGDWWWANTSPGDYFTSPIREIQHGTVTHWQPLPSPPTNGDEHE